MLTALVLAGKRWGELPALVDAADAWADGAVKGFRAAGAGSKKVRKSARRAAAKAKGKGEGQRQIQGDNKGERRRR